MTRGSISDRIEDKHATTRVLQTSVPTLHDLAITSLGPAGRYKIIQASEDSGATTITTTSSRLLQGMVWTHPLIRLLVEAAAMTQQRALGDGGLLGLLLASRLVLDCLKADPEFTGRRHIWICAWQEAAEWCVSALGQEVLNSGRPRDWFQPVSSLPLCLPMQWSDLSGVTAVIRGVISPKLAVAGLLRGDVDLLTVVVARAFINAVGDDPRLLPFVRVIPMKGQPVSESHSVEGLLLDPPIAPEDKALLPVEDQVVAAFHCPLDVPKQYESLEDGAGNPSGLALQYTAGQEEGEDWHPMRQHLQHLYDLLRLLASRGVRVVACQRVIHPEVRARCRALGIVPLERLSARHIGPFCRVTGASPIGVTHLHSMGNWERHLGRVGAIRTKTAGAWECLEVETCSTPGHGGFGSSAAPASTILAGGPSELVMDEMVACLEAAVRVLGQMLLVPKACPGGGSTEVILAQGLRTWARAKYGRGSQKTVAIESLSRALDDAAAQLAPSAVDRRELVECLREANFLQVPDGPGRARPDDISFYGWSHFDYAISKVAKCRLAASGPLDGTSDGHLPEMGRQALGTSDSVLLDCLATKALAISSAVEAASEVSAIAGTIRQ